MRVSGKRRLLLMGLVLFAINSGGSLLPAGAEADPSRLRVEIFLSKEQKGAADAIRKRFSEHSVQNVHFQFFRAGYPPPNVAIGSEVPAPVARLAIEIAKEYNRGVHLLMVQERLPASWLAIGSSHFDELSQIPVSPEDLELLTDPSRTTGEFHALYRKLARPKVLQ